MSITDFDRIAALTAGWWLVAPDDHATPPRGGVSIDSRTLLPGQAFLCLQGERVDGHRFARHAAEARASLILAERGPDPAPPPEVPVLLVPDAVQALHRLAADHRQELHAAGCRVVAVTGSNGKTTTRHLIHHVLSDALTGTQSPKSYNNDLGVPLTLLAADPRHDFVVVEIGTNHPGEIDRLAALTRPDVAVITQLGVAHLEHFGTAEAIANEKCSMLAHVQPGGLAVVPGHLDALHTGSERLAAALPELPPGLKLICVGQPPADLSPRLTSHRVAFDQPPEPHPDGGQRFIATGLISPVSVHLALPGQHNAANALAVLAVARHLGLNDTAIAQRLASVQPVDMRLNTRRLGSDRPDGSANLVLIDDAYNANPDSVVAALNTLGQMPRQGPTGRRVAILGDMLELGPTAREQHRRVGQHLARMTDRIDAAILIGPLVSYAAAPLAAAWPAGRLWAQPGWHPELPEAVTRFLTPGDTVLIKASRSCALERLIPAMEARFQPAQPTAGTPGTDHATAETARPTRSARHTAGRTEPHPRHALSHAAP